MEEQYKYLEDHKENTHLITLSSETGSSVQIYILLANTVFYGDVKQGLWHPVTKVKLHREETAINGRDLSNNLGGKKINKKIETDNFTK